MLGSGRLPCDRLCRWLEVTVVSVVAGDPVLGELATRGRRSYGWLFRFIANGEPFFVQRWRRVGVIKCGFESLTDSEVLPTFGLYQVSIGANTGHSFKPIVNDKMELGCYVSSSYVPHKTNRF